MRARYEIVLLQMRSIGIFKITAAYFSAFEISSRSHKVG